MYGIVDTKLEQNLILSINTHTSFKFEVKDEINLIASESMPSATFIRDLQEIRAVFDESGVSVAEWARTNGFSTGLVYQVLEGRRQCIRGQSHRIAVALGLRNGKTLDVTELSQRLFTIPTQPAQKSSSTEAPM